MDVTVSTKYQIVIPKDVRKRMGIKPGQKVSFGDVEKGGSVSLTKKLTALEVVEKYRGSLNGAWGGEDPAEYIRRMRDSEWD